MQHLHSTKMDICHSTYQTLFLSHQAIYQKAEIFYRKGNYEMALMTFKQGQKLSPGAPGFSEGIQKAQQAIDIMAAGVCIACSVQFD